MSNLVSKHIVVILFVLRCAALSPAHSKDNKRETYEQLYLFGQVFDLIKAKYVPAATFKIVSFT